MKLILLMALSFLPLWAGCGQNDGTEHLAQAAPNTNVNDDTRRDTMQEHGNISSREASGIKDTATLGAGCFWCVEAVFEQLDGVESVTAGYAGGHVPDPTYEAVCSGSTGHAEVAQVVFDTGMLSYAELLEMFWKAHDPTTLNRQGADAGTQYRSAIFYHDEQQRAIAEKSKKAAQAYFDKAIVTEITPLDRFYPAENYHQDYYRRNKNAPYCQVVIAPKLKKLKLED